MNLFKKKKKDLKFMVPISGNIIELSEIPDPVFSGKMMGDGFGINPSDGKVYSPIKGEVITLFPTNHAIGIKSEEGLEVLIHIGIDSVNLKGEGFTPNVKVGDKVDYNDLLITFDIDEIKPKIPSIITPIIFTNLKDYKFEVEYGPVIANDEVKVKLIKGEK